MRISYFDGYDKDGYDKDGFNKNGYHKNGYDKNGYDKDGYDQNGDHRNGFDRNGIYRNGTYFDDEGFAVNGFNRYGFNREGFNRGGYDKDGFNKDGYDKIGYNKNGIDKDGFNREGYNKDGFDREGYNRLGLNVYGVDRTGYDKDGYDIRGFDENGFDMEGYNIKGEFNEYIDSYLNKNKEIKKQTTDLIYTVDYKDMMLYINKALKYIGQCEYDDASTNLRKASEVLVRLILNKYNAPPKIKNSDLFSKLNYIKENELLNKNDIEILHNVRDIGNKGTHPEETTTKEENELGVSELKKVLNNWINTVS